MLKWLLRLLLGCTHKWEVLDKVDMPSPYEQVTRNGEVLKSCSGVHMFTKQATTVLACANCGAMKVVRTRNLTRWD